MDIERFRQLRQLGQEIANTAFWSASVVETGIEAVYQNPGTGMSSSPILIKNRQEWEYWQEKLGQYKAPQQRIKELEQQNAAMRALLESVIDTSKTGIDDDPGYTTGDPEESYCFFCGGDQDFSYKPPDSNRWRKEYHHDPDCAWVKIRAFLAEHPR